MNPEDLQLPNPVDVTIDGARIATYSIDSESPSATSDLVFCHGTPWSAQVWAPVARELAREYRVHLWDMPGYGNSIQGPHVPVDLAAQMGRLRRLIEHWQLHQPIVIAHDIGGAVALGSQLLHDTEYAGLFLWDVVTLEPWGSPFFQLVAQHPAVFAQLPTALHAALVTEYVAGAALHQLPDAVVTQLAQPWTTPLGKPGFYRQIAELQVDDTRPVASRLNNVRCPTAIGWGENDPWIPVEQAVRLRDLLPGNPPLATLPGVGHLAPLEAAGDVARIIDRWLRATAPLSGPDR